MTVRRAVPSEAGAVMRLINAAFGPAEGFFVAGDRVDLAAVHGFFEKGAFLVAGDFAGLVYVEPRRDRAYLGLLSVDPAQQGKGLGKVLVGAAEEHARAMGAGHMDLRVVNVRTELPPFYGKLGYSQIRTEPWPDGEPSKIPCHFLVMSKALE